MPDISGLVRPACGGGGLEGPACIVGWFCGKGGFGDRDCSRCLRSAVGGEQVRLERGASRPGVEGKYYETVSVGGPQGT